VYVSHSIRKGITYHATIARRHLASHTLTLARSLVVVRVRRVQSDLRVHPLVRGHGTTVIFGALNGAAPTLGLAVTGRERGDLLAVDQDDLRVVARGIVELVCEASVLFDCVSSPGCSQCIVILSPACAFFPSAWIGICVFAEVLKRV
jgi:hypothetical protein